MKKTALLLLLLGTVGCDPNVVDAVREPPPVMEPDPEPEPMNPLEKSLIHRYSFNGVGSVAQDSKVAAHGEIVNAELTGTGSLTLAGAHTLQYVDLPDHIIQNLDDATFEAWLTWSGTGGAWQRIFDFGNSSGGEDMPTIIPGTTSGTYSGTSYLFLTTNAVADSARGLDSHIRVAYSHNGVNDEEICFGTEVFPKNVPAHVAVVIDSSAETMALYQDGKLLNECPMTRLLADIDDLNNWLGRSNFTADQDLAAHYDEFRIYGAALTAQQIADSYKFGPDAEP
jgi:hypothetical protein